MKLRSSFVSVVVLVAAASGTALAGHPCPKGQTFSPQAGACVKAAPPAAPRSTQKKYEDSLAVIIAAGSGGHQDTKGAVATLDQNCTQASHAASCSLLGLLYARGRAVTADPDRAMTLFQRACTLGDLDGCFNAGDLAARQDKYAEARAAFVHACDAGNALACVRAGDAFRVAQGDLPADAGKSATLYQRGYTQYKPQCPDDGTSCYALGYLLENGYGIAKDAAGALAMYKSGCDGGSSNACVALGDALANGVGATADATAAEQAYIKGCDDDDSAEACDKIARPLANASKDLPRAVANAQRACNLDPKFCGTLGELYRLGRGVNNDPGLANTYYKTACDAGAPRWCTSFAERAHDGIGMTADPAGGIHIAEQACIDGDPEGCGLAAGYEVMSDAQRAQALAQKGCEGDDGKSCYLLAGFARKQQKLDVAAQLDEQACVQDSAAGCADGENAYANGTGVTADPKKARQLAEKGCTLNDAKASGPVCTDLVRMAYTAEPKDAETAMYAAARACALGEKDPCGWVAQLVGEVPGDHADIRTYLANNCTGGAAGACNAEATLLFAGNEADKKQALELVDAGCAKKDEAACMMKAIALYNGQGTLPQKDKAEAIYTEFCEKGNGEACVNLSVFANDRKDYEKAYTFAKRSCDLGNADGCQNTGYFTFTAKGTRWDAAGAVQMWVKACDLGSTYGCSNMGYMYRYGITIPLDAKKAFEAYMKSCTPNAQVGCQGAAHYYETGEGGTTKDEKKAAELYKSACESTADPVPLACSDLALMLERLHQGSAPELSRLRQLAFDTATEKAKNNAYGAWMLGTYYRDGVATVKSPAKAREWFGKSCEEGYDPLGCLDAGKAFLATGAPADADLARSEYLARACTVGLVEACDLKDGKGAKGTTPGAAVHAKGCGCQSDADGTALLAFGLGAVLFRKRRRAPR